MKKKLIIFDLDGTLIDTIEDLGNAVNYAMREAGYPEHNMQEYKMMVGNGIRILVQRALPEHLRDNYALVDDRLESFVFYYTNNIDVCTKPYRGLTKLLPALSQAGYILAVASNKFQAGAEQLVSKFFGDVPFCAVLGNSEDLPLKPSADVVRLCMNRAGVSDPSEVILVGDSSTDMKTAINAGIDSVGVTWGFRSEDELLNSGARHIVHNASQLKALFLPKKAKKNTGGNR